MGESDRTSTTSQLVPSDSASAAACSRAETIAPCPTSVTSVPRRTIRLACSGSARADVSTSPFIQYLALGSRKITGSGDEIASWIIQYASFGVDGLTTRRPGVWVKYVSGLS